MNIDINTFLGMKIKILIRKSKIYRNQSYLSNPFDCRNIQTDANQKYNNENYDNSYLNIISNFRMIFMKDL